MAPQTMFRKIARFLAYLLGKRSELKRLNRNDALLAKVILDIHRKRVDSAFQFHPLASIHPIHPIDRGQALISKNERVRVLQEFRDEILVSKTVSREFLAKALPSVSGIKVVEMEDGSLISYEGNGRIGALQEVFGMAPEIRVEVESYRFTSEDAVQIRRRIRRVRRWNGVERRK